MINISVINPNSSSQVTQTIKDSASRLNHSVNYKINCYKLDKSPEGIETDDHIKEVIPRIEEFIQENQADVYIIACFSDPGLKQIKNITDSKVIGIAEASYRKSISLEAKFGIVSILENSIIRHKKYLKELGLLNWMAGDRSIGHGVNDLDNKEVYNSIFETAKNLKNKDHAKAIILGCAGMCKYKIKLEKELKLPVLDPVETAISEVIRNY